MKMDMNYTICWTEIGMPYKDGKTIHDIEARFITEDAQMTINDFI